MISLTSVRAYAQMLYGGIDALELFRARAVLRCWLACTLAGAHEITTSNPASTGMASAVSSFDWAGTPLKSRDKWLLPLVTLVDLMLGAGQPMFMAWGPSLTWLYNDAFTPILGRKHPDALGKPASEVWAEAWDDLKPLFDRVFAGEAVHMNDISLMLDRRGVLEEAHFSFSYTPVRGESGDVVGLFGVCTETTDGFARGRAEAALQANEARLRFLDALGKETARSDDADEILAITTRAVAQHLGLSSCAYADMDEDEDGFTIRGDWAAPGSTSIVGHYSLADFGKLAVENLSAGLPLIINDNLAELDPAEAKTFRDIGIAATICMPLVKEGRLTALMAIHDKVPHQWTDHELALIREVTDRSWAHVERVRSQAEVRETAKALSRLNATLEEQIEERTGDLMAAEAALRQSQKMEAVGQLTGGLAHDFNNILAGISGSLELMQARLSQGRFGDIERYLTGALAASKRAASLTQRLLAFSRRQTLDPRVSDINRLALGMDELIRRSVGPAITLEFKTGDPLWPSFVDAGQLENALLNLCINARDAMPDGGLLIIETANRSLLGAEANEHDVEPGDYIALCVTDTGTGMPKEVLDRAFDPFYTTKPTGQGTGLGLSMVYGFAGQSNGSVRIESEVGRGTTVTLYLPRYHGSEKVEEEQSLCAGAVEAVSQETIMIVDDEPLIRLVAVETLQELGYNVLEAGDSRSALRIMESEPHIDLLVTDVGLPNGMNGRQLADAVRASRPGIPVLFVTGYAENTVLNAGQLDIGMHVMTKPFLTESFARRVQEILGQQKRY